MKRPLVVSSISLVIGIFTYELIPALLWGLIALILISAAMYLIFGLLRKCSALALLAIPLMLIGFLLHYSNTVRNEEVFMNWVNQTVLIEGAVFDEPIEQDGRISFVLNVHRIKDSVGITDIKNSRLKVSIYSDTMPSGLEYGSRLSMTAEIKKPQGTRNIGGFNYRRFLAARNISGTVNVNLSRIKINDGNEIVPLKAWGYKTRKHILGSIYGSIPEKEASLVSGMLIGYTQDMPESLEEAFRKAGLSHVMAVSGANIAFLLFPFLLLLKRIGFSKKWASVLSLPLMLFYVFATGMEASVIRAAIMAGVTLFGMILWRQTDIYCSMAFSVIIILFSNTFMLFDPGFILSFLATLSLCLFYKPVFEKLPKKLPKTLRDTLAGTLSAQLGVIPYIVSSFNTFSTISLISNLIIVPITGIITIFGALIAILWSFSAPAAAVFGAVTRFLADIILMVTQSISSVSWAEIRVATPAVVLILGYYLILLYIRFGFKKLPVKNTKSVLAVMLAVYGSMILISALPSGRLELYFVDVGQGDCSLIKTPSGKSILIDGGGSVNDDETSYIGDRIVVPMLYDMNVTGIDLMVASHGHADHIEGLKSVMKVMKVGGLAVADADDGEMNELVDFASERGVPVIRVSEGDIIYQEDDLRLKVIYPFKDKTKMPSTKTTNANELSIVARLDYREFSALFTGDIGFPTENKLLGNDELDCDLLKVGHHGSKYSSGDLFIQKVSPVIAIISAGENRYGHPSPEVEKKLIDHDIILYETIKDGGILVEPARTNPEEVMVKTVINE